MNDFHDSNEFEINYLCRHSRMDFFNTRRHLRLSYYNKPNYT